MGKLYITYLCISVYADSRDGKVGVQDLKETLNALDSGEF